MFNHARTSMTDRLLPGDLVEVRSEGEILATLDAKGTFENLPFMPEMLKSCGRQFRVARQAFKTCVDDQEMRRLDSTVFLEELRCDGSSHGGCGRACLIFWKEPWLKRVDQTNGHATQAAMPGRTKAPGDSTCSANQRFEPSISPSDLISMAGREGEFFCQSSEILNASRPLPWWQMEQYLWDLKYNKVPFVKWVESLFIACYNKLAHVAGLKPWKFVAGPGAPNNHVPPLNLMPGELVRVKSLAQIRETLDESGKNLNLLFAPAMADFCGNVLRVQDRLENIVLEGTQRQRRIKDTVLLEGATCDGICHRMCPRQSFLFWRECWLERVS